MPSFSVAAVVKNEGRYIAEWAAYHSIIGAESILIYDNGSNDKTPEVVRSLANFIDIKLIPWPIMNEDFNFTQKAAYEDASHRLAATCDFAAFIDIDEFLSSEGDIHNILGAFADDVGAIACQQIVFGGSDQDFDSGGLVIERFRMSARSDHPGHIWFKTIARLSSFERMETVHSVVTKGKYVYVDGCVLERPEYNPKVGMRTCINPLRINHYMIKSREEWDNKCQKMNNANLPASIKQNYKNYGYDARNIQTNVVEDFSLSKKGPAVREFLKGLHDTKVGSVSPPTA